MKIYEFDTQHDKVFVMFPCAAEPWWVFRESAEAMALDYHVYLVIADGAKVSTKIEYWYGEEERRARKNNLAYAMRAYPQTVPREFKGLAHAELVMMFPERFCEEVTRFLREE